MERKILDEAFRRIGLIGEPEIDLNEETQMIVLSDYHNGNAFYVKDLCDVIDVDLDKLRRLCDSYGIAYCL